MSSTVEIRWCVAPASRIAARAPGASLPEARVRRLAPGVRVDLGRRHRRPVGPGGGDDVEVAAQGDVGNGRALAQRPRRGQADDLAVDRDGGAARDALALQPVDVLRSGRRRDADQLDAAAGELALGLHPVAAVGEERGALGADDQGRHRARWRPGRPLARLPALRAEYSDPGAGRSTARRRRRSSCAQRVLDLLGMRSAGRGEVRVSMRCLSCSGAEFRRAAARPATLPARRRRPRRRARM